MRLSIQKTRSPRRATRALTLVEMLIGMAITLVMMAAVVNLFANIGNGVRVRRAKMELGSELRTARARLFKDLAGATVAARPKLPSDDHDDGYLEIIEGQYSDKNPSSLLDGNTANDELDYATSIVPSGADPQVVIDFDTTDAYRRVANPTDITNGGGLGDYDDILALTVRSESEPFVGQWFNPATNQIETIESDLAEIVWYSIENPADGSLGEPGMRTVYRRVLLIAPWLEGKLQLPNLGEDVRVGLYNFYQENDISVHLVENGTTSAVWVPNTLSALTKRENRFGHFNDSGTPIPALGFPFHVDTRAIRASAYPITPVPQSILGPFRPHGSPFNDIASASEERKGEDIMLNDVLAFDLRVYDANAPLVSGVGGTVLEPSDAGWFLPAPADIVGYGAYTDLGWAPGYTTAPTPYFAERRRVGSTIAVPIVGYPCVYDTWPYHYESDGLDQDGDGTNDEGTDGLDDTTDTNGIVDDAGERETSPPYPHPLRAMQAKIRVYDRDTRQIREATVTRNFVPQ